MIIIYPFSIKLTKTIILNRFSNAIANLSGNESSWIVVIYKFLSIFIFDNKFGLFLKCEIISNPLKTGFWTLSGEGSSFKDSGDKFLQKLFHQQQEKLDIFSERLASASLSISFSTVFHLLTVYFLLKGNIFNKITQNWTPGVLRNKLRIIALFLSCIVINILRYFMCFKNTNIWVSFFVRLAMISVCTPSSILLEWLCFKLYHSYLIRIQYLVLQLFSCHNSDLPCKESILAMYLRRGCLSLEKLQTWKASVSKYTSVISSHLHEITQHNFLPIDTGSIVERFGLPLASKEGVEDLNTDHDVMFVATDIVVSEHGGNVYLVPIEGLYEYYHLVPARTECNLLNYITDNEGYIENTKAKYLLDNIVTNVSLQDFQLGNKETEKRALLGMTCITLTQRFLKWDEIQTAIKGPAVNFRVKTGHLNPSLHLQHKWVTKIDCDFILAFHLDHWPQVARDWLARHRTWPSQEIIGEIQVTGCEVVPKVRSAKDDRAWRLSFSMAERILANHLNEKARQTYLAVKLFMKQNLKKACPFLKSYHIKTIFFTYMEKTTEEYWKETSLERTIIDFLEKLDCTMKSGICPHFFIPSVNLWGEQILGRGAEKVVSNASIGCGIIRKTLNRGICSSIIDKPFISEMFLKCIFSSKSTNFYPKATVLMLTTELVILFSLPVIVLCAAVLLKTILSWLLGMITCLPLVIIACCMLLLLRLSVSNCYK